MLTPNSVHPFNSWLFNTTFYWTWQKRINHDGYPDPNGFYNSAPSQALYV